MYPGPPRLSRRRFVQTSGLSLAGRMMAGSARAADLPILRDVAARAGLLIGTDSDVPIATQPPGYGALVAAQCNLFAPMLSWSAIEPAPGQFAREDPNIAFARAHGMRLTGAHLLWHLRSPGWLASLDDAAARAEVTRHVVRLVRTYAGQMYSWNVVNEAIETRHGEPGGIRQDFYAAKLGPDWMADAFRTARAADPHALLLYNDAGFEMPDPRSTRNREALLRLLDRLQRAGAPIDGVGTQSHLRVDGQPFDAGLYRRFLHDIAARGLRIVVSELDVFDAGGASDPAVRDTVVAGRYKAFLDAALDETAVKAVVFWGLSDRYTWLTPDRGSSLIRADGQPARPLPFDDRLQPKPALQAILDALKAAPARAP